MCIQKVFKKFLQNEINAVAEIAISFVLIFMFEETYMRLIFILIHKIY